MPPRAPLATRIVIGTPLTLGGKVGERSSRGGPRLEAELEGR